MRNRRRVDLAIALALILFVGFALYYAWRAPADSDGMRSEIVIVLDGQPITLDPVLMTEVMSASVGNACHCPLVRISQSGNPVFELAKSIELSPDALQARITLHPDRLFWDQTPVRSSDVAWSLLRLRDSQSPLRFSVSRIEECEENSPYELTVRFSAPEPDFIRQVGHLQAAIMKKDSDQHQALPMGQHLIGAGAFSPIEIDPGVSYRFRKNPGFRHASSPDYIRFIVKSDTQSQLTALRSGEGQILRLKGPALREAVEMEQGRPSLRTGFASFRLLQATASELDIILLNWSAAPLNEVAESRRKQFLSTLSARFDRVSFCAALAAARPAYQVVPPSVTEQDSLERGGLEEATLPALSQPVELLCSTDPMSREMAYAAQPLLTKAGLRVTVRQMDPGRLIESVIGGKHQAVIISFEMPVVGVEPWLLFFSPGPFSAFGSPLSQLAEPATRARSIIDLAEREEAWREVISLMSSAQQVWLPLASKDTYILMSEAVEGVQIDAAGTPYWSHIRFEKRR